MEDLAQTLFLSDFEKRTNG